MLLEARGLRKRFGGLRAVHDLDLSVARGEVLGLIGPNGSGKSTAMSLVMGIHRPDAGTIRIDGTDVAGWAPERIAGAGVAMMFQHSRPLDAQTVLQNVQLALLPNRLLNLRMGRASAERARTLLARVGLEGVADRRPGELPFAGLRRVELAQALARDPKLVLLDEPFAGLSAAEVREFSVLVRALRAEGRAVILVDHNVKGVRALVDRMVAMSAGAVIADGEPDRVLADPEVRRVYLGGGTAHAPAPAAAAAVPAAAAPLELEARAISVRYGRATALHGVSLSLPAGGVTALVGLNGAGKSSLFNAICGLVPKAGEVVSRGVAMSAWAPDAIARAGIVLCPETRELFGDLTVAENLRIGGGALRPAELVRRTDYVQALFPRLAERRQQNARTLSGGEQQQLAIGRALMMNPRVLLIDEPTLGLAPVVLDLISDAIEALRAEGTMTLLIAEQNITFAARHADTIHLLEHGEVTWSGSAAAFERDASHRIL